MKAFLALAVFVSGAAVSLAAAGAGDACGPSCAEMRRIVAARPRAFESIAGDRLGDDQYKATVLLEGATDCRVQRADYLTGLYTCRFPAAGPAASRSFARWLQAARGAVSDWMETTVKDMDGHPSEVWFTPPPRRTKGWIRLRRASDALELEVTGMAVSRACGTDCQTLGKVAEAMPGNFERLRGHAMSDGNYTAEVPGFDGGCFIEGPSSVGALLMCSMKRDTPERAQADFEALAADARLAFPEDWVFVPAYEGGRLHRVDFHLWRPGERRASLGKMLVRGDSITLVLTSRGVQ